MFRILNGEELMKKNLWGALFCVVAGLAFAEAGPPPGTVTAQGGLGLYWEGVAELQAGANVALTRVTFSPQFPVDFGASARLFVGFPGLALGAYATATYDFEALDTKVAWFDDVSVSLGLGPRVIPNLGIDGYLGLGYQFDPDWGAFLEASAWGSILGLSYQF